MSGVFNMADAMRGSGHIAPIMQARTGLYQMFKDEKGREPHGDECDRLDRALDGLLMKNVGFEHVPDEGDTWFNQNYLFDEAGDNQAGTWGDTFMPYANSLKLTCAEYGIDKVVSSQSHGRVDGSVQDDRLDHWVRCAYRIAMQNMGDADVAWMHLRYNDEPRPRLNEFDVSGSGKRLDIDTPVQMAAPTSRGIANRSHREDRIGDSRREIHHHHFESINPLPSRPDPMSEAQPNI
jgi:hypothetical protein